MKSIVKYLALGAATFFPPSSGIVAAVFTNLHNFAASSGGNPSANLVWSGTNFYGTTFNGGVGQFGTVFRVNRDGSSLTNLHSFNGIDGASPCGALVVSADALYGTTEYNDSGGSGTVFRMNLDGTGFTNLHGFSDTDGASPAGLLVLSSNFLYGTTQDGSPGDYGSVFRLNIDGTGFTNLYSFSAIVSGTNSDGGRPFGGLVLSGSTLYGTTPVGGPGGNGTIFRISADGTGFANLHAFSGFVSGTNCDGGLPYGGLLLSGETLFGTTQLGGAAGFGTVFKINTDGTGFTSLHSFAGGSIATGQDGGAYPFAGLTISGTTLYGTTEDTTGGSPTGYGTVFQLSTDGTGFAVVYHFSPLSFSISPLLKGNGDGADPLASLTLIENTLYGTARYGGTGGNGTLFALALVPAPIPLRIQACGSTVVLSWADPTLSLQASPAVSGVYTKVPGAGSPYTNTAASSPMFFRLAAQ